MFKNIFKQSLFKKNVSNDNNNKGKGVIKNEVDVLIYSHYNKFI